MKVNFWYWLRAFFMTCGFIGTVFAIRKLDRTRSAIPEDTGKTVNICPTRVTTIAAADVAIVQEGYNWYRKVNGRMEELDPIAVEKWFGRHCKVTADELGEKQAPTSPVATFSFVSGQPETLSSAGAAYIWMGQSFHSKELEEALATLKDLPLRLRPSR